MANDKQTDLLRWSDQNNLNPAWSSRSEIAAQLISSGDTVLDIGCGNMHIEQYLPPMCKYIPCDVAKRDDRTFVFDFNQDPLPDVSNVNIVTLLGVVEYMSDVTKLLKDMKKYNANIVMSYNIKDLLGQVHSEPDSRWFNYYTKDELYSVVEGAGYRIISEQRIEPTQILMKLVSRDKPI